MEPIGRSPIPAPILILGKAAMAGSLCFFFVKERFSTTLLFDSILTSRIGAVLGAAGLLLVLSGFVSLGRSLSVGLPEEDTQLKTRGIYHFTRNPLYLGGFIACAGSCLYASHIVNILLTIATIGIHHWIITREETFLEQRFGRQWLDYKRRVPRYVGAIRRTAAAGDVTYK